MTLVMHPIDLGKPREPMFPDWFEPSPAPFSEWLTELPFTREASLMVDRDLHLQEFIRECADRQRLGAEAMTALSTTENWDQDGINPDHLREWVEGSGVDPEIAALNVQSLDGDEALQALTQVKLDSLGAHAQQYATAPVARLFNRHDHVTAGGWWCGPLKVVNGVALSLMSHALMQTASRSNTNTP